MLLQMSISFYWFDAVIWTTREAHIQSLSLTAAKKKRSKTRHLRLASKQQTPWWWIPCSLGRRPVKSSLHLWGDGRQEGSFPNSFSCGLSLHGWLSTGLLPLGPAAEEQFMCPSSRAYCTDSRCLSGIILPAGARRPYCCLYLQRRHM